jgi:hypothetical protein
MEDDFNPGAGPGASGRIGQIALDELHRLQAGQIGAFAGDEIINAADRITPRQQRGSDGPANETGNSSNKITSQNIPPFNRSQ